MRKELFCVLALAGSLAGCDMVDAMKDMTEKSQAASAEIEKTVGAKAQVGFNIQNHVLTNVNVVFDAGDVGQRRFDELEPPVRKAVEAVFQARPKVLVISVTSSAKSS